MRLILGGPGCGKTTALVNEVRGFLRECAPDEIGFVAFTRKAADEARDRCAKDLNLDPKDMVYFRTIHSLCFRELQLNRNQVMQDTDYKRLAKDVGMDVNRAVDQDFGLPTGTGIGDRIIFFEQYARSTGKRFESVLDANNINPWLGKQYRAALKRYKASRGLWDFTDMIEKFISYGLAPRLKVLVVDEAQDLSHLHWRVVDMLAKQAGRLIIAGDDDQTIYRWAGADIKRFLSLDGERRVLPVSHRLPQSIFELANRILGRISKRYPKEWRPRDEEGEILNLDLMDKLAKYLRHGSWYCLARHAYLLPHYKKVIEREGFVYEYKGRSSTDTTDTRAIIAWERLRKGKEVSLQECQLINRRLHAALKTDTLDRLDDITDEGQTYDVAQLRAMGLRATPDWVEALHVSNREYYRACLLNGEKLTEPPRIKLATVHGVKGGEADNVAILPDLSNKAHKSLMQKPDNEHRVFYVGATRARHRLFLMAPKGALTYAF